MAEKSRIRVPALTDSGRKAFMTRDSFQNFAADLGYGANNLSSASSYRLNPIGRNHTVLEWMYRGSWLVRKIVDCPANDMTRAGLDFTSAISPDQIATMHTAWKRLALQSKFNQGIKWGRLYGGAISVILVDGQDESTELRVETVQKGQFKGLLVLDRWMVNASTTEFVKKLGPDFGMPMYYETITDGSVPRLKIHHSRVIRHEGDDLPYWQRIAENGWTSSVIEQLYDRMIAFDSATTGAAQLVYKAHLRTYKVAGLRELIATGGKMYQAFLDNMAIIRQMQTNEGLTIVDDLDTIEYHTNSAFSGLSDALNQFGQQVSGASGIPLVILFGQSPAGLSGTGEGDTRNYYDRISSEQHSKLEMPCTKVAQVLYYSTFGQPPPADFAITFNSLWQQTETERATNAQTIANAVKAVYDSGIIDQATAMSELKQSGAETGVFTNITDEAIKEAKLAPPPPPDLTGHNGGPPLQDADTQPPGQVPPAPGASAPASPATPSAPVQRTPFSVPAQPANDPRDPPPPEGSFRVGGTPDNVKVNVAEGTPLRVNYNMRDAAGKIIRRQFVMTDSEFREDQHKRDDGGKFSSTGGAGRAAPAAPKASAKKSSSSAEPSPAAEPHAAVKGPVAHLRPDPNKYKHANDVKYTQNKLALFDKALASPDPVAALAAINISKSFGKIEKYKQALIEQVKAAKPAAPQAATLAPAELPIPKRDPKQTDILGSHHYDVDEKLHAAFAGETHHVVDTLLSGFAPSDYTQAKVWVPAHSEEQVKVQMEISTDAGTASMIRTFDTDDMSVMHDFFKVPPALQGSGVAAKSLINSLPMYKSLGYNKVHVHASLTVGGYAWAKYGFVPSQESWDRLRRTLRNNPFTGHPEGNDEALNSILDSTNPKSIGLLADHPGGKKLLIGSDWNGTLDLNDKDQYNRCISQARKSLARAEAKKGESK